jgi:hypothetical protein
MVESRDGVNLRDGRMEMKQAIDTVKGLLAKARRIRDIAYGQEDNDQGRWFWLGSVHSLEQALEALEGIEAGRLALRGDGDE